MNETLEVLIKQLIQQKPSRITKNTFVKRLYYTRKDRQYTFELWPSKLTFNITESDYKERLSNFEFEIKEDRLYHEIIYKMDDWIELFENDEIRLLEANIVEDVVTPNGMESLLDEDKDE